ncbi:bifunctional 2-methylcitrate synthase/citrate synthase [Arcticibacterium luteifluviistationis]|uniref:Citrate synthase n=1 Tax=Arcticibacterium luteifluviistationis TaxID=1784714 RepID=A0A2Z4GF79_9BACT|nr:bifunctional 2-methylcitrate synthase/citrate synthase [Arcticibacterium luteifluviistationis]AWV99880.1 bifunctional 2-methylcitrate synthase/citrate synthase [Arcticibacterium luteifluviistationis]
MNEKPIIFKGLAGVTVDYTSISKVMPETNSLTYRGYAVEELCEKKSFEDVAFLLVNNDLPNAKERAAFIDKEKSQRTLSKELLSILQNLPKSSHPMDTLRTGVSILGCEDTRIWDSSRETNMDKYISLLAKIPAIIAASYRHQIGQGFIPADNKLSFSENFFYMCFGKVPAPEVIKAFDVSLILYAEHSFNASTFTARVITSTTSDIYSAVTGAIGALKGPLHGGANEQVMHMLKEVVSKENAEAWMLDALINKKKIMGFGHRVYRNGDSRVPTMKKYALKTAEFTNNQALMETSAKLEEVMVREKGIYPNLDFPAGPAYYMMGFEIEMFTPIFVMSRIAGWAAHIMEQNASNKLIRPLSAYDGVGQREVE